MAAVVELNEEGAIALLAALVRQAVMDYRAGYTKAKHPSAAAFLRTAGLLGDDGAVQWRGQRLGPQGRRERHQLAVSTQDQLPPGWQEGL